MVSQLNKLIDKKLIAKGKLARELGISNTSLSRYISGERKPRLKIAKKLADILECSVEELFFNPNN
jgi:DNA-binding XRE family transcriptional regulator